MGHELNPTAITRLRQALQPDWVHTVRARRLAAAGLVVLAGASALRDDPRGEHSPALVATRDLTPGTTLTVDDVRIENRMTAALPDGVQSDAGAAVGATVAGPVRRGELLTDVRLLGSRLAEASLAAGSGTDARVVPLHLADNAVLDVIRAGDVVDILAAPDADPQARPRVVATEAVVVLVSPGDKAPTANAARVVLVALPTTAANAVAGAALVQSLTLTLH